MSLSRGILVCALGAGLTSAYVVHAAGQRPAPAPPAPKPVSLPGTATMTGTVEAAGPFKAAQVFIRNTDRHVLYMVYTRGGRFRAVALFPGTYEVTAKAPGLEGDVRTIAVKAGESPAVKLSLKASRAESERAVVNALETEAAMGTSSVTLEQGYDEVFPPGPGREIAERTCFVCHGENFIASRPGSAAMWTGGIDHMVGKNILDRAIAMPGEGLLSYKAPSFRFSRQDRGVLIEYLTKNFGPGTRPRAVKVDQEIPLDEAALGRAMYMEYYLPPDGPGEGNRSPEYAQLRGMFTGKRVGQDVRFDADGNVWLTDRGYPHRLVRLDPRTGQQKSYLLPDPKNGIHDISIDRTGMIWLPEHAGMQPSTPKRLLGFNPTTEKFEHLIPMDPDNVIRNPNKWMQSFTITSKGDVYVGWLMGGALSKYDRATQKVSVITIPIQSAIPYGVVADRNDNIWIAMWDAGNLAKYDTHTGQWTTFTPPTYPSQIRRLNVDAHNNIWFGLWAAGNRPGKLGKLDQATGRITEYTVPRRNASPYDVYEDAAGNIWCADVGGSAAAIWKFNPKDETFTLYPKPQKTADTPKIMVTREGAVWYSPRSSPDAAAFGVLYPDMDKITTLGAFYLNGPPGYAFKPVAPAPARKTE